MSEKKRNGKFMPAFALVLALGFICAALPITAQAADYETISLAGADGMAGWLGNTVIDDIANWCSDAINRTLNLLMQTRFNAEKVKDNNGSIVKRVFTYEFDPATERFEVSLGLQAGTEDFNRIVWRQWPKVQVNAGFFGRESIGYIYSPNMIVPQGLKLDGKIYSEPAPNGYNTLFIYKDGSSEVIKTSTLDALKVNAKAENAVLILSGGDANAASSRQRTMIGVRADGSAILMVADSNGRNTGMTVPEGKRRLQDMGAVNVLNLDGGGSSRMYVIGRGCVTNPLYDPDRKIGSVLQIYSK